MAATGFCGGDGDFASIAFSLGALGFNFSAAEPNRGPPWLRCARSEASVPQGFAGEGSGMPEYFPIPYAIAEIRRLAVTPWPFPCSPGGGGNAGSGQVFWVAGETRPERFPSSRCSRRSSEWCRASLQTRLFTEKQQARCLVLRGQGEEPLLFSGTVPHAGVVGRGKRLPVPAIHWPPMGNRPGTSPDRALAPQRYSWRRASTGSMLAARQAG